MSTANAENTADSATYEPRIADVLVVKAMLARALPLPAEIIDRITDLAEYWPHTTTEWSRQDGRIAPLRVVEGSRDENVFLIRAPPLGLPNWRRSLGSPGSIPLCRKPPRPLPPGDEFPVEDFQRLTGSPAPMLAHPCRRIVFTIRSEDQGWGGTREDAGTYRHSWTWFEAGLERWCSTGTTETDVTGHHRPQQAKPSLMVSDLSTVLPEVVWDEESDDYVFSHPLLPREDLKIQCNVVASREVREHRIVWSYTDDIDRDRDVEAVAQLAEKGRGTVTGNGKFVRDLKLGDVVTVWAKARFPGWQNRVHSIKLDIYYAV